MKLRLVAVGRLREAYIEAAAADFRRRLGRYEAIEEIEVPASHGGEPGRAVRQEGDRIVRLLDPGEPLWLLERTGIQLASREIVTHLADLTRVGHARVTIAIAGTYGASDELIARANFCWSLSRLTFLHEWVRVLVLEQLYRAAKIARNEPYHH